MIVGAEKHGQDNFGRAMASGFGFGLLASGGCLLILSALNRLFAGWARGRPQSAREGGRARSAALAGALGRIAVALVAGNGVALAMMGIFALDKDVEMATAALIGSGFGLAAFSFVCWVLFHPPKSEKPEPLTKETPISASGVSAAQLGETGPWHVVEEKR